MASGYKIIYNNATVDLSDVYMEKQYFSFYALLMWGGVAGSRTWATVVAKAGITVALSN
jgi:hypothetical protein